MDSKESKKIIKLAGNSISCSSISKTNHDINSFTGLPDNYARLYLSSVIIDNLKNSYKDKYSEAVLNSFSNDGGFVDIIVTKLDIPLSEKTQIHSLWGDNYLVVYYGLTPPQIQLSGAFYNARNNDWWDDFINMYIDFLRGTNLSLFEETICLAYYENNIYFSMASFYSGISSDMQAMSSFAINGVVHKIDILTAKQKGQIKEETISSRRQGKFPHAPLRSARDLRVEYNVYYEPKEVSKNTEGQEVFNVRVEEP